MKRKPTPENRVVRTKVARADSRSHPRIDVKSGTFGPTTFSDANAVGKTKREILRAALALKWAACRDVLIVGTAEYVRFIVTIKLPRPR